MTDHDLVEVFRGGGGFSRSDFLSGVLEQEEIPCLVSSEASVAGHPFTVGPMGEFRILVSRDDADRALDVLTSILTPLDEADSGDG